MASTIQKKPPSQQIAYLFHHSLIKFIILHQLEKRKVSWDVFITHPDFSTVPPIHTSSTSPTHHPSPSSSRPIPKKLKFTIEQVEEPEEGEEHDHDDEEEDEGQQHEDQQTHDEGEQPYDDTQQHHSDD